MNYFLGIDATSGTLVADFEDTRQRRQPSGHRHDRRHQQRLAPRRRDLRHARTPGGSTSTACSTARSRSAAFTPESTSIQHAALGSAPDQQRRAPRASSRAVDEVRDLERRPHAVPRSRRPARPGATSGTGPVGRYGLNEGTGTTVANVAGGATAPRRRARPGCAGSPPRPTHAAGRPGRAAAHAGGNGSVGSPGRRTPRRPRRLQRLPLDDDARAARPARRSTARPCSTAPTLHRHDRDERHDLLLRRRRGRLADQRARPPRRRRATPTRRRRRQRRAAERHEPVRDVRRGARPERLELHARAVVPAHRRGRRHEHRHGRHRQRDPAVTKGRAEAETPANLNMDYFLGIDASTGTLVADFEDTANGAEPPRHRHGASSRATSGITPRRSTTARHLAPVPRRRPRPDPRRRRVHARGDEHPARRDRHRHDQQRHRGRLLRGRRSTRRGLERRPHRRPDPGQPDQELTSGTGLIGRWGLNEASGATAANSVSGGVAGTLVGGPTRVPGFVPIGGGGNNAPVAVGDSYSTPRNTT